MPLSDAALNPFQPGAGAVGSLSQGTAKRERLHFNNFTFTRTPAGICTAEVELEWVDGVKVMGKSVGNSSPMGDLRIAAEAGLRALEAFAGGAVVFELAGIKAIRAFDANILIVAVGTRRGEVSTRLLGAYLAERDPIRGAVVAVLNATNRVLGNFVTTR
jgi:hypothetical protein